MLKTRLHKHNYFYLCNCGGYISLEYAVEGLYSTKSYVFSYFVLMLDIISGKRNNHYHVESPCLNLIGHVSKIYYHLVLIWCTSLCLYSKIILSFFQVWDLWEEGKPFDIVDSSLHQAYPPHQVSRCIHIVLLCMQEQATDWPRMAEILFKWENETSLPPPNKTTFINWKNINYGLDSSSSAGTTTSLNDFTFSVFKAH